MSDAASTLAALLVRNFNDAPTRHGVREPLYESYTARLVPSTPSRGLGAMVVTLPPGKRAIPYHLHHAEEEMFVVLEGRGTIRIAGELLPIVAGDVVYTPPGRDFPHQVINTSDEPLKYLAIGTHEPAEICEYPDSGKYMVYANDERATSFIATQRAGESLDYWDGEP